MKIFLTAREVISIDTKLKLEAVTIDDANILFDWANEENVRKNSFSMEPILYEDHINWLVKNLKDKMCYMYIAYDGKQPVGQIRINIENEKAYISYSVDCAQRGKGYGLGMLMALEDEINQSQIPTKKLVGLVKCENKASIKAFEKASYNYSYVEFEKEL